MPGKLSVRVPPSRRQTRVKSKRQTSTRTSSTYANNKLRTPTISRPGASLGQGKSRGTIIPVNARSKRNHKVSTVRGLKYTNYRISNRNPMND